MNEVTLELSLLSISTELLSHVCEIISHVCEIISFKYTYWSFDKYNQDLDFSFQ